MHVSLSSALTPIEFSPVGHLNEYVNAALSRAIEDIVAELQGGVRTIDANVSSIVCRESRCHLPLNGWRVLRKPVVGLWNGCGRILFHRKALENGFKAFGMHLLNPNA
jgi:hypothetical protein